MIDCEYIPIHLLESLYAAVSFRQMKTARTPLFVYRYFYKYTLTLLCLCLCLSDSVESVSHTLSSALSVSVSHTNIAINLKIRITRQKILKFHAKKMFSSIYGVLAIWRTEVCAEEVSHGVSSISNCSHCTLSLLCKLQISVLMFSLQIQLFLDRHIFPSISSDQIIQSQPLSPVWSWTRYHHARFHVVLQERSYRSAIISQRGR